MNMVVTPCRNIPILLDFSNCDDCDFFILSLQGCYLVFVGPVVKKRRLHP